jgi:hypothetical protein
VTGCEIALTQSVAQPYCFAAGLISAEQAFFEAIEEIELIASGQGGMIRDVVGGSHELIKRQNDRAVARMDQT